MSSKLKTILMIICASILVIGAGLFGVYKYFVTPDKLVMLSMLNMRGDFEKTFNYISEDEKEIFSYISENGGKFSLDAKIEELSYLTDVPVSLTVNSDKTSTVTSIDLYDSFGIDVYKDSSQILINTPLFGSGGFSIPVSNFANEWNSSIFKDMFSVSSEYAAADILLDIAKGNINAKGFISANSGELLSMAKSIDIKKDGTSKVVVGDKTKNAKRYKAHITKDQADTFISRFSEYFASTEYGRQKISALASAYGISEDEARSKIFESVMSASSDFDVIFKIYKNKIREIYVEQSSDKNYTLAFSGETNVFDVISYYKNGDIENEIKRSRNRTNERVSDTVSVSGKDLISFESSGGNISFKLDSDYLSAQIDASGKNVTDYAISFDSISININDLIALNGSCELAEDYDEDFSFSKSGDYVDLLSVSQAEWEQISGTILKALELLAPKI